MAKQKPAQQEAKPSQVDKGRSAMTAKAQALLADFAGDLPHEAAGGFYNFGLRDRWHGHRPGLFDGWYHGSGWAIRISGGLPVEAAREDHPAHPKPRNAPS